MNLRDLHVHTIFSDGKNSPEEMVREAIARGMDIIGHFDLITKFYEGGALFDETEPRYIAASRAAADVLLKTGKPFEINTGAISRGYRTAPYPSLALRDYIRHKGGSFLLSSDSHAKESLCFQFAALESESKR